VRKLSRACGRSVDLRLRPIPGPRVSLSRQSLAEVQQSLGKCGQSVSSWAIRSREVVAGEEEEEIIWI
jgi:hypothetical protein